MSFRIIWYCNIVMNFWRILTINLMFQSSQVIKYNESPATLTKNGATSGFVVWTWLFLVHCSKRVLNVHWLRPYQFYIFCYKRLIQLTWYCNFKLRKPSNTSLRKFIVTTMLDFYYNREFLLFRRVSRGTYNCLFDENKNDHRPIGHNKSPHRQILC